MNCCCLKVLNFKIFKIQFFFINHVKIKVSIIMVILLKKSRSKSRSRSRKNKKKKSLKKYLKNNQKSKVDRRKNIKHYSRKKLLKKKKNDGMMKSVVSTKDIIIIEELVEYLKNKGIYVESMDENLITDISKTFLEKDKLFDYIYDLLINNESISTLIKNKKKVVIHDLALDKTKIFHTFKYNLKKVVDVVDSDSKKETLNYNLIDVDSDTKEKLVEYLKNKGIYVESFDENLILDILKIKTYKNETELFEYIYSSLILDRDISTKLIENKKKVIIHKLRLDKTKMFFPLNYRISPIFTTFREEMIIPIDEIAGGTSKRKEGWDPIPFNCFSIKTNLHYYEVKAFSRVTSFSSEDLKKTTIEYIKESINEKIRNFPWLLEEKFSSIVEELKNRNDFFKKTIYVLLGDFSGSFHKNTLNIGFFSGGVLPKGSGHKLLAYFLLYHNFHFDNSIHKVTLDAVSPKPYILMGFKHNGNKNISERFPMIADTKVIIDKYFERTSEEKGIDEIIVNLIE